MSYVVMQFAPAALERDLAAAYAGLSVSTFEKEVREDRAPKPRQVAGRRVCWLRAELDAWLHTRPVSDQLPPDNTGARKPRQGKATEQQGFPNAQTAK